MKKIPPDFLLGAATSAYQIEGAWNEDGKGPSIWDDFAHFTGTIRNNDTGDIACDHYHRFKDDIALMKEIGLECYRFSIAWPRLFPDGPGSFNQRGVDFYSRLVDELLAANIKPFATLFHWDMPRWVNERCCGWLGRDSAFYFADYSAKVFEKLGDRIDRWITHNEPKNVHIEAGYGIGNWPPQISGGLRGNIRANHNIMLGHGLAVQAYRATGQKGEIGASLALSPYIPWGDPTPENLEACRLAEEWDIHWNLDLIFHGKYNELTRRPGVEKLLPVFDPDDLRIMATPSDFVGLNHYHVKRAFASDDSPFGFEFKWGFDDWTKSPRTGMGWPITPESMHAVLHKMHSRVPGVKIYVTENGTSEKILPGHPVNTQDPHRVAFLRDYLHAVLQARDEGVQVAGYMVWSLMDNLEWTSGFEPRFGLIAVDPSTRQRTLKESARWYADLIRTRTLA